MLKENTVEVQLQNSYYEKVKLHRAKIIRDGNCLFRAFALALFSDQERYGEVRKKVVDRLQHYWWLFENILPGVSERYDIMENYLGFKLYWLLIINSRSINGVLV